MNVIYSFGPGAHPTSAMALRDALADTYPTFGFRVEMVGSLQGLREGVVLEGSKHPAERVWSGIVLFARGFVAGCGHTFQPANRTDFLQQRMTQTACPAAKKRRSAPPPKSDPTLPSMRTPIVRLSIHPTLIGVAPQRRP
jgi:hypothetical protein